MKLALFKSFLRITTDTRSDIYSPGRVAEAEAMFPNALTSFLDISVSTAKNYWNFARAWLYHEIEGK